MAGPMGALLSLWGRRRHVDPPVEGALPVLDAGALLRPHRSQLATIRQLVGVPRAHWVAFYATVFEAYAGFVQQLPASEAHHHAGPGGMLVHGLEVVREALKLRRGRLLPPGAAAEELAARQDLWTYATATGALLHDLGKPVTDQRVRLYDRQGRELGHWDPWAGPLPAVAGWYRVEFVRERRYRFHERVPPLLVRFILPQRGLSWLASDPEVFGAWLAAISGDADRAGVLGELVHRADGLSVASDLAGVPARMSSARRKPLVARLLTGLRYLLDQGSLPLNRPGAAGWRLDDDLWLVSKRVLDALREHLSQEGQEGVPTRNDRLMDELQQHGLLTPNGDRAVWIVQVTTGDWSQQLTVLRFPLQTLWPDPDARPPVFDGSVAPVGENRDDTTSEDPKSTPGPEPSPPDADDASEAPVEASPSEPRETEISEEDDPGHRFLHWLKEGLASGSLLINAVNARVHVVPEGLLLVSPGIFKDFDRENWTRVQKRFQKLKLHKRTPQATNIWSYQVKGDRKQSRINGLLITEPEQVLGLQLPPPNPHLTQKA
ncbi:MobH family relaxase [Thiohalobacter sp. IOR34]|uniref:MobH family relaxase n=1 Tax=Thiohalobacter sp. IOR34 TaxID=3057176 RepID=UPI0025AFEBCF|nr:MobH family relaxase [Thiohalobacter sp. IOR34]WJW74729.1 MobH family relaxase [Thiohalobacter sp. IOR34]